jgi:hypothetical protein
MSKTRVILICIAVIATISLLVARLYGYIDQGTPAIIIGLVVAYACIYFGQRGTVRDWRKKWTSNRS